jgi:gluconate:H+ symporter, GntP family
LMVVGSGVASFVDLEERTRLGRLIVFLGDPMIAMLIGVGAAYWLLGSRRGTSATELASLTERSLFPVANVLLIVGAGAGFSRVLIASGAGDSISGLAQQLSLPPLMFGWLMAAAVRVATGSATTAITTAAGLLAVMVEQNASIDREWMVLAMGAGSLTLSHVNDGGFWFVKEYLGMTVEQTLKTWTVLETVLSVVALALLMLLDWLM